MTDSSDPRASKSSRKKSAREPATIDLKATVLEEGISREDTAAPDTVAAAPETIEPSAGAAPEAPPETLASEAVASPEASLDSGLGTDSISQADSPGSPPPAEPIGPETAASAEPPPRQAPAPERRSSAGAMIGAGLLGGVIGAGLLYGLQTLQDPSAQDDPRFAQIDQRLAALSQQRAPQGDLQALDNRLKAVEAARGAVDQRLQGLQATAERAAARAEEAFNRPLPQPAPQNNTAVTELTNRVAALENQVRSAAQSASGATQAVERRVAEQESRITALQQQVTAANRGAEASSQAGLRVALAGRLNDALRTGAPYAPVLDALRKAGVEQARVAALEPFAQSGAPTAAALEQSFRPLSATILRDERSASGEWGDRLLRMMNKVVTVRPVNEAGGTGAGAAVARIEQALGRGDIAGAAAAWDALPEPARRASEAWGQQVKARAKAGEAAQALTAESLAGVNRSTP